ncbi:HD-GYP domain-containing protein [Miltoncostaea oceani]|uniref:HD-GYP domain-containing protein n=1 Tax=Miltoncostaea oceani TaxID=2843216 RepID=UPI001C3CEC9B|nr:HD domain-containing phosphohydrolase [Miltoncostaea oceani]
MRLGRPVYSCSGGARLPLLQPDALVTDRVRAGLERAGVFAVYVDDAVSEGITPTEPISPELRDRAVRELGSTFTSISANGRSTRIHGEQIERLGGVVSALLRELRQSGHMVSALMDLQSFDAHTLGHSLNVCVLGLMLGDEALRRHGWTDGRGNVRRDGIDSRLEKLGLGLLLHDVGKLLIPAEILQKPGRLTDDEMDIVREHPQAGLDLIEEGAFSSLSRVAVIGHHERLDGKGYPHGRGEDLHVHAQIAGIADVYDAVSSMRVYQARRPTHEAWELVLSLAGTAFPLDLVRIFKHTVAPYPEGVAVQLSDGRRGLVSRVRREHINRPTIRVTHDPDGAPVTAYEFELADAWDVVISDTLQDLDGPPDAPPDRTAAVSDERHEQQLASITG